MIPKSIAKTLLLFIRDLWSCNKVTKAIDNIAHLFYCGMMKLFLNASEVSRLLKVNRATITRWAQKGAFKGAIRQKGKKEWQIPIASYEEFIKNQPNESR